MARLRAVFIIIGFLVITLLGIPVQWLLLKLRSPAARTLPWRYHKLVAALFGIHIKVIG
jgi:1-acyl-sn-glycerol-3-phosphate acyltransferase